MDHYNPQSRTVSATVDVKYRRVQDYHVFTCAEIPGLYVSSKDARRAFKNVPIVLKELIDHKLKISCTVEPTVSFEDWVGDDTDYFEPTDDLQLEDKRFLIREAA